MTDIIFCRTVSDVPGAAFCIMFCSTVHFSSHGTRSFTLSFDAQVQEAMGWSVPDEGEKGVEWKSWWYRHWLATSTWSRTRLLRILRLLRLRHSPIRVYRDITHNLAQNNKQKSCTLARVRTQSKYFFALFLISRIQSSTSGFFVCIVFYCSCTNLRLRNVVIIEEVVIGLL